MPNLFSFWNESDLSNKNQTNPQSTSWTPGGTFGWSFTANARKSSLQPSWLSILTRNLSLMAAQRLHSSRTTKRQSWQWDYCFRWLHYFWLFKIAGDHRTIKKPLVLCKWEPLLKETVGNSSDAPLSSKITAQSNSKKSMISEVTSHKKDTNYDETQAFISQCKMSMNHEQVRASFSQSM